MSRKLALLYGTWRDALLGHKVPRNVTLGPEDRIQRATYLMLCDLVTTGEYRGVFFHPANEAVGKGPKASHRVALLRSLGMMPGVTDWVLVWRTPDGGIDAGFVELKAPGNYAVEPSQKHFRAWTSEFGLRYALCKSPEQFRATLVEWGAIRA